nr:non-canonical purine NTP pyrophosphatase [Gemmatimonadota bacterium]
MKETLLVATRSSHKLREVRDILAEFCGFSLLTLADLLLPASPDEDGLEAFSTFAENAFAKARFFAGRTGMLTLADDSGLCVDALAGAPGVRSKRFSGRSDLEGDRLD